MEPFRSLVHRLAPVALAALGILGALLTIFAGLVALNHSVLPFKGWPLDAGRLNSGTQVLPRAPVATGRLRTAPGGALAAALGNPLPLARVAAAPVPALSPVPRVIVHLPQRAPHPVSNRPASRPAPAQPAPAQPVPAQPAPAPAPVAATPAPTPVAAAVASSPAPAARRPVIASRQPSTATPSTSPSSGHGKGLGRAHAPGQLKKVAVAAAPPAEAAPAVVPPAPAAPADDARPGKGNGHGHGPPPWAQGHR